MSISPASLPHVPVEFASQIAGHEGVVPGLLQLPGIDETLNAITLFGTSENFETNLVPSMHTFPFVVSVHPSVVVFPGLMTN